MLQKAIEISPGAELEIALPQLSAKSAAARYQKPCHRAIENFIAG
jgi:hypothetical protein